MAVQATKRIFVINGVEVESWNESRAILDYAKQVLGWNSKRVFFTDDMILNGGQTEIYNSRTRERHIIGPVIDKAERERMQKAQ
jgi:hypothetical protein